MVDRLVGQGLLERSEDPNDRRFKQVTLTPAGKSLVESGIEARQKWMERLTSNLTPEEQQMIVEALSLLAEAAQKLDLGEMQSE
jgi:MarR family transcriptional regulator for hemolysin